MSSVHSLVYRKLLERLREARSDAGVTQAGAAKALGRPQSYVSKCESGERRLDVVELLQFARIYGTSLAALVGEAEARTSRQPLAGGAMLAAERRQTYGARKRRPRPRRGK